MAKNSRSQTYTWMPVSSKGKTREAKARWLKVVAHELRTPITCMLGYAELLLTGEYDSLSERQEQAIARLLTNGYHLADVVNKIVDQACLEAGVLVPKAGPLNLEELIAEVDDDLRPLAEAKGLKLTFSITPTLSGVLRGDRRQLRQILVNLVENAIKFTDEGYVAIRARTRDADHFAVEVVDTGTGIPDEARTRIFEPFEIGEDPMTRRHRGLGLGLPIASGLARQMGGAIEIESKLGKGSTFTVVLPTHRSSDRPQRDQPSRINALSTFGGLLSSSLQSDD